MDAELIRLWNDTAGADDTVYHLGDFTLQDIARFATIAREVNGRSKSFPAATITAGSAISMPAKGTCAPPRAMRSICCRRWCRLKCQTSKRGDTARSLSSATMPCAFGTGPPTGPGTFTATATARCPGTDSPSTSAWTAPPSARSASQKWPAEWPPSKAKGLALAQKDRQGGVPRGEPQPRHRHSDWPGSGDQVHLAEPRLQR